MHIDAVMNCAGCESRIHAPGRTWGDPDDCYPDEALCKEGASGDAPCERMCNTVHDMVLDGRLEVQNGGYFIDRDWAVQVQQGDTACEVDQWFMEFDFSVAPYWYVPYPWAPCVLNYVLKPKPYQSIDELIMAWFF